MTTSAACEADGATIKRDIPPDRAINALLLQALFTIPSKTKFVDATQDEML